MSTTAAATGTVTAIPAGSTEAPIPVRDPAAPPPVILRPKAEESITPVFVRNRNTPSVTFGDSSLGEGAKGRAGVVTSHTRKNHVPLPRHSEAARPKNPHPSSLCLSVTQKDGGYGFFASLRMTKGGAQNDGREGGAFLRSPPQSGCAGQLPRPGGAVTAHRVRWWQAGRRSQACPSGPNRMPSRHFRSKSLLFPLFLLSLPRK